MFEDFLEEWLAHPFTADPAKKKIDEWPSLWTHGRNACLATFERELLDLAHRRHRKAMAVDAADFVRRFEPLFDHDADTVTRAAAAESHKDIQHARLLVLRFDPLAMDPRTYFWVDGIITQRASAHRTTVVLTRFDADSARRLDLGIGDIARLVDYVLARGRSVEVSGDGAAFDPPLRPDGRSALRH